MYIFRSNPLFFLLKTGCSILLFAELSCFTSQLFAELHPIAAYPYETDEDGIPLALGLGDGALPEHVVNIEVEAEGISKLTIYFKAFLHCVVIVRRVKPVVTTLVFVGAASTVFADAIMYAGGADTQKASNVALGVMSFMVVVTATYLALKHYYREMLKRYSGSVMNV